VVPQKNLKSFDTHDADESRGAGPRPEEGARGPEVKRRAEGA
jgi:hypothetical protein